MLPARVAMLCHRSAILCHPFWVVLPVGRIPACERPSCVSPPYFKLFAADKSPQRSIHLRPFFHFGAHRRLDSLGMNLHFAVHHLQFCDELLLAIGFNRAVRQRCGIRIKCISRRLRRKWLAFSHLGAPSISAGQMKSLATCKTTPKIHRSP